MGTIYVGNINKWWNNSTWLAPVKFPDYKKFKKIEDANIVINTPEIGTVILEGDYNYAFCKDRFFHLERMISKDIDIKIYKYAMIKDMWYELRQEKNLKVTGTLNKVYKDSILKDNLDYTVPLITNPAVISLHEITQDTESAALNAKPITFQPRQYLPSINSEDWDEFIRQYELIPDKNQKKTKEAVLAVLKTTSVDNWQYKLLHEYINPFVHKLKNNPEKFDLLQSTSVDKTNGKFMLWDKDKASPPGYVTNIKYIDEIDLSTVTNIVPIGLVSETIPYNKSIEDNLSNKSTLVASPGYVNGVEYWPDAKPWENKSPVGNAKASPFTDETFGITQDLLIKNLAKTTDGYDKIHITTESTVDFLKANKSKLDEIDLMLKGYASSQDRFLKACIYRAFFLVGWTNWEYHSFKSMLNSHKIEYVETSDGCLGVKKHWYFEELPRKGADYDYEAIVKLLNSFVATITQDSAAGYDKVYYAIFEDGKKVLGFDDRLTRQLFLDKLAGLRKTEAPNPKTRKSEIYKHIYSSRGWFMSGDNLYYPDLTKGYHLFSLSGSDYTFGLFDGSPALILENNNNLKDIVESAYTIPNTSTDDVINEINTRRVLTVIDKDYELQDRKPINEKLKIIELSNKQRLQTNEALHITLNAPLTVIFDSHEVPRRLSNSSLINFNLTEYNAQQLSYKRSVEDFIISDEERQIQRREEAHKLYTTRRDLNIDWSRQITSMVIGGVGTIAGMGQGGFGALVALQAAQTIGNSVFDIMNSNNKFRDLKFAERQSLANLITASFKVDTERKRIEEDNKLYIDGKVKQTSINMLLDRDLINMRNKYLKINDIHIKKYTPSNYQKNLITAHYKNYGVDCIIADFTFDLSKIEDQTIWGFEKIDDNSIKDPILKTWFEGIIANGVKFVDLTF